MSPIITSEDELELASLEKELVTQIRKLAKAQSTLIDSQKKIRRKFKKSNTNPRNA